MYTIKWTRIFTKIEKLSVNEENKLDGSTPILLDDTKSDIQITRDHFWPVLIALHNVTFGDIDEDLTPMCNKKFIILIFKIEMLFYTMFT